MQDAKSINVSVRKLILLAIIGVIVLMFSDIPYFNLFANTQTLFFAVWLIAVFVLKFDSKITLISFFTVLLYCLILILLGQEREAQVWGNWSFPILIITLMKYYWENRKEIWLN